MDNAVFHEWVDAVVACQEDYNLKNTLPSIVSKLSDMRVVSSELDLLIYEPVKNTLPWYSSYLAVFHYCIFE